MKYPTLEKLSKKYGDTVESIARDIFENMACGNNLFSTKECAEARKYISDHEIKTGRWNTYIRTTV
ncbi:hypothetical protein [Sulfuricurvum sp.]|uniref:hypothetical protein n=1 Tax=Sulfuricurvum sp. TaxID=2025608 RepID=UPI0035684188